MNTKKTTALPSEVRWMNPADLLTDSNIRLSTTTDKDFIASIRDHGVLMPVVAVTTSDGALRVRYGNRRTLAAIETKQQLPVYIAGNEDDDTVNRILQQWAENEHRTGLSTGDKVEAVRQLSLAGLSDAQIVRRTKASKADVVAAKAAGESDQAMAAAERYDTLTLDQAAMLAQFEDDPDTFKALTDAAVKQPGQFAHIAQRALDKRELAAQVDALKAKLTEDGVRIIGEPSYGERQITPVKQLGNAEGVDYTDASHKQCPGHAAYIVENSWSSSKPYAVTVCTDPRGNGHRKTRDQYGHQTTNAKPKSEEERQKAAGERREVIENRKAWPSAEKVRRTWLRQMAARKTAPKGAAVFAAQALARVGVSDDGIHLAADLLGLKTSSGWHADANAIRSAAANASDNRAQVITLTLALATCETRTNKDTWRRSDDDHRAYFAFLAAQGYTLSDVEALAAKAPAKKRGSGSAA